MAELSEAQTTTLVTRGFKDQIVEQWGESFEEQAGLSTDAATEEDLSLAATIPVDPKETELLALAQHGDDEALTVVWKLYEEKVFNTALRILRDYDEAENVAQDVFIKFKKNIHTFKLGRSPLPWLNRICKNHCINILNRARRHPINLVGSISGDDAVNQDSETSQYYGAEDLNTPSPFEILSKREDIANLRQAITRLHKDFRDIIYLHYTEELPYKVIAERLNIPIGTVMSRLFNAKAKLREEFKKVEAGV